MKRLFLVLIFVLVCGCVDEGSEQAGSSTSQPGMFGDVYLNLSLCDKGLVPDANSTFGYTAQSLSTRNSCYSDIAIRTNNPSICDGLHDTYGDIWCYTNTAQFLRNTSLCDKLGVIYPGELQKGYKEDCLKQVTKEVGRYSMNLAKETNDSKICATIEDGEYRDQCYLNLASITGDAGLCDNVIDNRSKEHCKSWAMNDLSFCDNEKQPALNAGCYLSFVYKLNDTSLCDRINNINGTWKCYGEAATAYKNKSLCDKINDTIWKDKCYALYSDYNPN